MIKQNYYKTSGGGVEQIIYAHPLFKRGDLHG